MIGFEGPKTAKNGKALKKSGGKANPTVVNDVLKDILDGL